MTPRDLLLSHQRKLKAIVEQDAFSCTTKRAKRWLAHVNLLLRQPHRHDEAPMLFGPNMHGPALDALYTEAEFHARRGSVEEGFWLEAAE